MENRLRVKRKVYCIYFDGGFMKLSFYQAQITFVFVILGCSKYNRGLFEWQQELVGELEDGFPGLGIHLGHQRRM